MDKQLLRTFLTVIISESFVAAAQSIHVTQSTISQRIQKLEDIVGHQLFERSKSGVVLTVHGAKFEQYARSMIQLWDEAMYQTSLPEGYTDNLSLGCEQSLWPELSAVWLAELSKNLKTTTLSFKTGDPQNLSNLLLRGRLDIGVMYTPAFRPGFQVEKIMDDSLVLVTGMEDHPGEIGNDYVYANWGPEFAVSHSRWFPTLQPPQVMLEVGPAIAGFLIENKKSGFLPYRMADDYVADGKLHFVKNSPEFPYPCYAVWAENKSNSVMEIALEQLRSAAGRAPLIELPKS